MDFILSWLSLLSSTRSLPLLSLCVRGKAGGFACQRRGVERGRVPQEGREGWRVSTFDFRVENDC